MQRAFLLLTLLLISGSAGAQAPWSENGLKTDHYKYVPLVIEVDKDDKSFGLTEDRVRNHVELRLRSVGLRPGKFKSGPSAFLFVQISIVGAAFIVQVQYRRIVDFTTGKRSYQTTGVTWWQAGLGTHGNDVAFVMSGLDPYLDQFLNEYLKVNQK